MPTFSWDKNLKRVIAKLKTCTNVICVKWMDSQTVTLIRSNVGNLNQILSVLPCQKGASSKSTVPCPIIVKKYNQSMGGVDLCDQYTAAYHLDRRSKFPFYLRIFFDLMDVAMVNSFIIYDTLHPNLLPYLDFTLVVSDWIILSYSLFLNDWIIYNSNQRISKVPPHKTTINTSCGKWFNILFSRVSANMPKVWLLFDWWDWKPRICHLHYMWYAFVPSDGEKLFSASWPTYKQMKKQY